MFESSHALVCLSCVLRCLHATRSVCGCVWYARHYKYVLSVCASGVDTLFGFVYVFMCECMRVSVPGGGHMRRFEHATSAVIRYTLYDVISAYDISDPRSSHFQANKFHLFASSRSFVLCNSSLIFNHYSFRFRRSINRNIDYSI